MNVIVLAGGKSSRMGENKAQIELGGNKLIQLVINSMSRLADDILIISNEPDELDWLKYKKFNDIYKDRGPLGGIHSGLMNSNTDDNFVVSCDMPFISSQTAWYLSEYHSKKPARVAVSEGVPQPVFGIYSKRCIDSLEEILKNTPAIDTSKDERFSPINYLKSIDADLVDVTSLPYYSKNNFLNINTKEDLEKARILLNL